MNANLDNVKAGDVVAVYRSGWYRNAYEFVPVIRATATQVVIEGGRFNRKTGREVGNRYGYTSIYALTPENKKQIEQHNAEVQAENERRAAVNYLQKCDYANVPTETLLAFVETVKAANNQ